MANLQDLVVNEDVTLSATQYLRNQTQHRHTASFEDSTYSKLRTDICNHLREFWSLPVLCCFEIFQIFVRPLLLPHLSQFRIGSNISRLWPGAHEMIQVFISVYIETGCRLLIFSFLQFETWLLNIMCYLLGMFFF